MLDTIRVRRDFLAVRGGARCSTPAFLMEAKFRRASRPDAGACVGEGGARPARFGFTITKKLGNAVCRNRIRRRLKAAICQTGVEKALAGADYVVVARRAAYDMPFADLLSCVERGMSRVNAGLTSQTPSPRKPPGRRTSGRSG